MPIDRNNVRGLVRAIAYDVKGARLGRVAQVFLDDRSDEPAWVAVDVTRVRGMRLLPLAGAALKGRHLVIRALRSTVRSAPRIDLGDGQLSSQDEARLLEHFGLTPTGQPDDGDTGEQRPASPWPDDTERETAWERPAQRPHDTQAPPAAVPPASPTDAPPVAQAHPVAQGWDQPAPVRQTQPSAGHESPRPAEAVGQDQSEAAAQDPAQSPARSPGQSPAQSSPAPPSTAPIPVQPGQPSNPPQPRSDEHGSAR